MFSGVGLSQRPRASDCCAILRRRLAHDCRWLSLALTAGVLAWGLIIGFVPAASASSSYARIGTPTIGGAPSLSLWDTPPLSARRSVFIAWRQPEGSSGRGIEGVLTLFFGLAGAYLAGAKGGAWGFAVAGALKTVNAWWQFSLALRDIEQPQQRGGTWPRLCGLSAAGGPLIRALVYEVSHETAAVRLCLRAGSRSESGVGWHWMLELARSATTSGISLAQTISRQFSAHGLICRTSVSSITIFRTG